MGEISNIEWTDATWNPWYGCHKVSPGCAYCYMDRWAKRRGSDFDTVTRAKDATFSAPMKWKEPQMIFTCSLSDFFIEEADEWRIRAWDIIAKTPWHTYLILTKRADRFGLLDRELGWLSAIPWLDNMGKPWPNVWLGVSAENQRQADERIPKLLQIPAAKRFVSIEPLLGPIDLIDMATPDGTRFNALTAWKEPCEDPLTRGVDWVIVGGESGGPEYRMLIHKFGRKTTDGYHWKPAYLPVNKKADWVRSLRDQCQAAGVPFFFKQWGGPRPDSGGHLIDGREWKEIPGQ